MKILSKIVRFILRLFGKRYEQGTIVLVVSGPKTMKISTPFVPKKVWISLSEPQGIPVCGGDIDAFDTRLLPDGFVLYVNLSSEAREVEWLAKN